jgi:hypothetical protein
VTQQEQTILLLRLENRALKELALRVMVSQTHHRTEMQAEQVIEELLALARKGEYV